MRWDRDYIILHRKDNDMSDEKEFEEKSYFVMKSITMSEICEFCGRNSHDRTFPYCEQCKSCSMRRYRKDDYENRD